MAIVFYGSRDSPGANRLLCFLAPLFYHGSAGMVMAVFDIPQMAALKIKEPHAITDSPAL